MRVLSNYQMRKLDELTIHHYKISSLKLMNQAGKVCASSIINSEKRLKNLDIDIFCGAGNNGGDGLVIALELFKKSKSISIYMLAKSCDQLSHESRIQLKSVQEKGINIIWITESNYKIKLSKLNSDIIVDAIFGTGLARIITGYRKKIIHLINSSSANIYSIDIPSGLCADTGHILGAVVEADTTITLEYPKLGFFINDGPQSVGRLIIRKIGLKKDALNQIDKKYDVNLITKSFFTNLLKTRKKEAHKGSYAHVYILGTSSSKIGAGLLTAKSSLKMGAGLSTLILPEKCFDKINSDFLEVMYAPVNSEESTDYFTEKMTSEVVELIQSAQVVAMGMGMGIHSRTQKFFDRLISRIKDIQIPVIIDADGLNLLSKNLALLKKLKTQVVLTPHPKEMSRLINKSVKFIQSHRIEVVHNFCIKYGVTLVLKGYRTIIGFPDGKIYVNSSGNPSMANAGQGDTLTGMIAGLIAEFGANSVNFQKTILFAVFLHGLVGDLMVRRGHRVTLASDITNNLHLGYNFLKKKNDLYEKEFL